MLKYVLLCASLLMFGVISCPSMVSPIRKFWNDSIWTMIRFLPLSAPAYCGCCGG
ncbi:hypothetical protein D3C86_2190520 [compost metagenome]